MTHRRRAVALIALLACSLPTLAHAEPSASPQPAGIVTPSGFIAKILAGVESGFAGDAPKQGSTLQGDAMEKQGHVATSIGLATMAVSIVVLAANVQARVDSETPTPKPTEETHHIDGARAPDWRGAGWSAPRPKTTPVLMVRF